MGSWYYLSDRSYPKPPELEPVNETRSEDFEDVGYEKQGYIIAGSEIDELIGEQEIVVSDEEILNCRVDAADNSIDALQILADGLREEGRNITYKLEPFKANKEDEHQVPLTITSRLEEAIFEAGFVNSMRGVEYGFRLESEYPLNVMHKTDPKILDEIVSYRFLMEKETGAGFEHLQTDFQ